MEHRAGYAAILGLPNAGKSTLMNAILGQKISITTSKPQTTRKSILGILSEEDYQIIFLDTPGILEPGYLLQQKMMDFVMNSIKDADVLLLLIDMENDFSGEKLFHNQVVREVLDKKEKQIMFVLNKIDKANEQKLVEMTNKLNQIGYEMIIPVSAQLKVNTKTVVEELIKYLPEHPKYFPDDIVSSENERFFVSEIIREKIFELYSEEIPYSTEVVVIEYKERENNKDFIQAEIYIERNSQKGIIIGKNGETIKKLGSLARKDIEEFLGKEVFLDIRVKVKEKWRNNENLLKSFGYNSDSE